MKLDKFGLKFKVLGMESNRPATAGPSLLIVNGNPSYTLYPTSWGFMLSCEHEMSALAITSLVPNFSMSDMEMVIVDCPGFCLKSQYERMQHVRDAIACRIPSNYGVSVRAAIEWWLDSHSLEKDNQSP